MTKLSEATVLKICKTNFTDANTHRIVWDEKIKEWRRAYNAEPYGNEEPYKSQMVSRDIRRQSEWLVPTLVDPFTSTPNLISVEPIGVSDRSYARQQEVLLNTQFCRLFDRFNFMNIVARVADRDGTVIVMAGWEYDEAIEIVTEYKVQTADGSIIPLERYITLIEEVDQYQEASNKNITLDNFIERQQMEQEYQEIMPQAQQLFMQLQASEQQFAALQQQGVPTEQLEQAQAEIEMLNQQAQQMQAQLQELINRLQQPIIPDNTFNLPEVVALIKENYEEVVVIKNNPTAVVCRNEDIFIDPTCQGNINKAQFVVYRYETDLSTLRQSGKYTNLDKVRALETTDGAIQIPPSDEAGYMSPDESNFSFTDEPRQKLLVHEYWGNLDLDGDGIAEAITCAWVNDTIIRLSPNPYPDKKHPFLMLPFMAQPFHLYGESTAELTGDLQRLNTSAMRGIIDQISKGSDSQIGIKKGALGPADKQHFIRGENFEFNGTPNETFWQGNFPNINPSIWQTVQQFNSQIESMTGVRSFGQGIASNRESATATRGAMDATSNRRLYLVRNISENLIKPLLRKWLEYDKAFLDDVTVYNYTGDTVVEIRRDKLSTSFSLDINISTFEDNQMKSQQLAFLLQTYRGPDTDPEIAKMMMAEMFKLNRMWDMAARIEKYQPQPDPVQQKAQELELAKLQAEIDKLKSEAQHNLSRAAENEVDGFVKQAKAQLTAAQARKTQSDADLLDQKFLQQDVAPQENPNLKTQLDLMKQQEAIAKRQIDTLKTKVDIGKLSLDKEKFDFDKQKTLADLVIKDEELELYQQEINNKKELEKKKANDKKTSKTE
jgi:hypothetical protein